jgi:ribonuclease P protein component
MLPTANRLTSKKDFDTVKQKGILTSSESFSISIHNRGDNKPTRYGFIISTKISPHATVRNKSKRALREGVRRNLTRAKPGFDCVFLAKPIIVKKYTDKLIIEVGEALENAQVV